MLFWHSYHAFIPGPECVQCGEVPKRRVHLDLVELQRNLLHCYGVQDTGRDSKWDLRVLLRRLLRLQPRLWTDEQPEQHVHRAGHLHPWHRCRPMHLQDLSFWDSLQVEAGIYQSYSHSTCRQAIAKPTPTLYLNNIIYHYSLSGDAKYDAVTAASPFYTGHCIEDSLNIASPGHASPPEICGVNTGQHMFIPMDTCVTININIGTSAGTRSW